MIFAQNNLLAGIIQGSARWEDVTEIESLLAELGGKSAEMLRLYEDEAYDELEDD